MYNVYIICIYIIFTVSTNDNVYATYRAWSKCSMEQIVKPFFFYLVMGTALMYEGGFFWFGLVG